MLNRSQAPAIHGIEHIAFVQPQISKLKNGVDLFWRNGIFNDTSKIELHFKAGSCIEQPIIGSLCAGLLISGTANKNARQIQKALDSLGAYYDVSISQDEAVVSIYALKDQLLAAYSVFHESLFAATFPNKELQDLCTERRQKFLVQQEKVSFLAQRQFQKSLFANSNYAQQIQLEDYDKASVTDIHRIQNHGAVKAFGLSTANRNACVIARRRRTRQISFTTTFRLILSRRCVARLSIKLFANHVRLNEKCTRMSIRQIYKHTAPKAFIATSTLVKSLCIAKGILPPCQ